MSAFAPLVGLSRLVSVFSLSYGLHRLNASMIKYDVRAGDPIPVGFFNLFTVWSVVSTCSLRLVNCVTVTNASFQRSYHWLSIRFASYVRSSRT